MKVFQKVSVLGALAVGALLVGCLNDSGSRSPRDSQLKINAGFKDVNKVKGLGKTSVITLSKLIVTLRSSDIADSVRRDTILADTGTFSSVSTSDQVFAKNYAVKPLRSWTVVVKTLDVNDSVIHYDSVVASNLLVGETRPVTVNLSSRFVMYEARFTVPDSLRFTQLNSALQLFVRRVVMRVNGTIVADSTRLPRFTPVVQNTIRFDYIRVSGTPDVRIEFYGRLDGYTNDTLMFETEFEDVDPSENPDPVVPTYTGPRSEDLNAIAGLTINIGKVGTVVLETNVDGNVPKRAVE